MSSHNFFGTLIPYAPLVHASFEVAAFIAGYFTYRKLSSSNKTLTNLSEEGRSWIFAGCFVGAFLGARLLSFLEWQPVKGGLDYLSLLHGNTVVGGLLGGWIGVEVGKFFAGIRSSTGDGFVFPIIVGMMIGRIGCFLTGLPDGTAGIETTLSVGINFGDGVFRHPAQLYELFLLISLGLLLRRFRESFCISGLTFRVFVGAYLLFRFFIEFIKLRGNLYFGLSAIQWASAAGLFVCILGISRSFVGRRNNGRSSLYIL